MTKNLVDEGKKNKGHETKSALCALRGHFHSSRLREALWNPHLMQSSRDLCLASSM